MPVPVYQLWYCTTELFKVSVQLSCLVARQASQSITNSQSLLKLMSIESVMPSNHLILCRPLLLLPSIFPSIRAALRIRWPKYWTFSFNLSRYCKIKNVFLIFVCFLMYAVFVC